MEKMLKNILIRELTDEEREAVELVKRRTGLEHACRAVMAAVLSFSRTDQVIEIYRKENERLKNENRKLHECLKRVRKVSREIDLLMDPEEPEPKRRIRKD